MEGAGGRVAVETTGGAVERSAGRPAGPEVHQPGDSARENLAVSSPARANDAPESGIPTQAQISSCGIPIADSPFTSFLSSCFGRKLGRAMVRLPPAVPPLLACLVTRGAPSIR